MKKFISWLKSPASDFALLVILLILANLAGHRAFLRCDLTQPKSYSLSPASRQVMKTLDAPLSVKVFFSDNLPAPYSSTAQYVRDMLVEYKGASNRNFSYTFMDMSKDANKTLAADYGLNQIQIQELKNSEVGFKQAYMGIVVSYADAIETLDVTGQLRDFQIGGFDDIEKTVQNAVKDLNKKNMDRIDYQKIDPSPSDLRALSAKDGM